ncbi:MAG: CDP-glycerol glycerophosphotransferase family protein, partial [Candidatus Helarchaeota archaeon]
VHAKNLVFSFDTDPFYFYKQGLFFKKLLKPKSKMIFLQHGVIHSLLPPYSKKYTHFDMFVCSARREMEQIKNDVMDYYDELKLTGLARFDELYNSSSEKVVFFMPTWDNKLLGKSINEFFNSNYFKMINAFLSSKKLDLILSKYNYKFIFVMHYMFNNYLSLFENLTKNITLLKMNQSKEFIFPLKKTSAIFITNQSSVLFDFAYMKKPAIYYQFDKYHFDEDFNYETEGFGKVVKDSNSLLIELEKILKNNCKMDKKYVERVENFFEYIDNNNCKRNYQEIRKL